MVAFVQHVGNATGGAAASLTVTIASTTAGNCLVVCVSVTGTPTISSIKLGGAVGNFAQLVTKADGVAATTLFIWVDPNCAGGQTAVLVTPSSSVAICADVFEFSGIVAASPLDKSSTQNDGGTATTNWSSGATATTTQAAEAWVGACDFNTSISFSPSGPGAPWTNETALGSTGLGVGQISGYQITSSTGAATYSGTQSAANNYAAGVVTLKSVAPIPAIQTIVRQAVKRANYY